MEKIFYYGVRTDTKYYIEIDVNNTPIDRIIVKSIGIPLKKYINILKKFNAERCSDDKEYYFNNEEDCKRCCDYLNEKYEVIVKLMRGC